MTPASSPLTGKFRSGHTKGRKSRLWGFMLLTKGQPCQASLSVHDLSIPVSWVLGPREHTMQARHGEAAEVMGTQRSADPVAQLLSATLSRNSSTEPGPSTRFDLIFAFFVTSLPTFCIFQVASVCLTMHTSNQSNKCNRGAGLQSSEVETQHASSPPASGPQPIAYLTPVLHMFESHLHL